MIVEYAEFGNLRDFMRRFRAEFAARLQRELCARELSAHAPPADDSTPARDLLMSSVALANSVPKAQASATGTKALPIHSLAQGASFSTAGAALTETNTLYSRFSGAAHAANALQAFVPEADADAECALESPIAQEETEGLEPDSAMAMAAAFTLPDYEVPRSRRPAGQDQQLPFAQSLASSTTPLPAKRAAGAVRATGPSPPVALTYSLLLDFARQVADGMNYLSSRKVFTFTPSHL